MPAPLLGDESHALINRGMWVHGNRRAGHDLPDFRFFRGTPFEDYLARVVAFRDNPDKFGPIHHDESSDAMFGHDLESFVDRHVGRHGEYVTPLLLQDDVDWI